MKKILFAFLLSISFVFTAIASNDVNKINSLHDSKFIKLEKFSKIGNTNFKLISKFVDPYCSYTSYANDTQSYSGLVCAPDANTWYTIMNGIVKLLDQLDAVAKLAAH